ncbi:MAG: PAS domain S-box protein [Bdellovibrio sp.]|nr:PAS domain S-box protein [Bdellovibrio sp.]
MVFLVGCTVLIGWLINAPLMIKFHPALPGMVFNTALCLTILSLGVIFSDRDYFKIGRLCAILAMFFGAVTYVQYPLGLDFGIDRFFIKLAFEDSMPFPGRMAATSAIAIMLLGLALFFNKTTLMCQFVRTTAASLVLGTGLIGMSGHLFRFNAQYGWGSFTRSALHTSICFVFLALALLLQLKARLVAQEYSRKLFRPFYVLISGVLTTLAIMQLLLLKDFQKNRAITEIRANAIVENFDSTLNPLKKALGRMARRFTYQRYDSYKSWEIDADSYLNDFGGIRRITWIDKNMITKWVYPMNNHYERLLGMNILAQPETNEIVKWVIANKQAALSGVIELKSGGQGFLLFSPILKDDKIDGLLSVAIVAKPFFEEVANAPGYYVKITEDGREIISNNPQSSGYSREWSFQKDYKALNAKWNVIVTPNPETILTNSSILPAVIAAFGVSISVLLSLALMFYVRSRASERKMKETLDWQEAGLDSSPLMMIQMDQNSVITSVNKATELYLGYEEQELVGRTPFMLGDHADAMELRGKMESQLKRSLSLDQDYLEAMFETGVNLSSERVFTTKSGQRRSVIATLSRVRDEDGKVIGYLTVAEDVTEKKEKERLLKEQAEKIIVSSRLASLGEMAAGIAHEINNPLAVMGGYISVLRKNLNQKGLGQDVEIARRVDSIDAMIQRIAKIVRGLRSYAHESHHGELELIDVEQIIDDTLAFCYEKFKTDGIKLSARIQPGLKVKCRPYQISQVLLNLLNNAHDAVVAAPVKEVLIEAEVHQGGVEISVTDSGPGVPAELREKIMQPFFTTKEVGKGVGLGLSISQGIMTAHDGKFYLDKESLQTRFVLWLPSV